ncbi:MAG TPA: hypothetical protein VFC03_09640 [Acidimicrobiales bacterium]|nr:hypothetical protein [Acidimicrobiales bacterium]
METALPVLVVDDQAPFRSAAKAVVGRMDGFDVVGEATSGEEASPWLPNFGRRWC